MVEINTAWFNPTSLEIATMQPFEKALKAAEASDLTVAPASGSSVTKVAVPKAVWVPQHFARLLLQRNAGVPTV